MGICLDDSRAEDSAHGALCVLDVVAPLWPSHVFRTACVYVRCDSGMKAVKLCFVTLPPTPSAFCASTLSARSLETGRGSVLVVLRAISRPGSRIADELLECTPSLENLALAPDGVVECKAAYEVC